MSRGVWAIIRQRKRFYVATSRSLANVLTVSVLLTIVLNLGIYAVYFSRADHDFYSTDGATPPVALQAMSQPNYSSYPLLANDQTVDDTVKVMPK